MASVPRLQEDAAASITASRRLQLGRFTVCGALNLSSSITCLFLSFSSLFSPENIFFPNA